jgi:hypothetical protein
VPGCLSGTGPPAWFVVLAEGTGTGLALVRCWPAQHEAGWRVADVRLCR